MWIFSPFGPTALKLVDSINSGFTSSALRNDFAAPVSNNGLILFPSTSAFKKNALAGLSFARKKQLTVLQFPEQQQVFRIFELWTDSYPFEWSFARFPVPFGDNLF